MKGVEVRVKIDNSTLTPLDPECAHCAQTFSRSGIMDFNCLSQLADAGQFQFKNPSELQYFKD